VRDVERSGVDRVALRESARRFDVARFEQRIREIVREATTQGRAI